MGFSKTVNEVASFLETKTAVSVAINMSQTQEKKKQLIDIYSWFFPEDNNYRPIVKHSFENMKARATAIATDPYLTPEGFARRFLVNVLMQSYHVFDESYEMYEPLLEAIRIHNPEWLAAFQAEHERRIQLAASHGTPIWRGSQ